MEKRFRLSRGADPIFRSNDGSDCPGQGVYTLLRSRGLFRVSLPIPEGAEFELESVADPFGMQQSGFGHRNVSAPASDRRTWRF